MKKIDESAINSQTGMLNPGGVLQFLQDTIKDTVEMALDVAVNNLFYPNTANIPYILKGVLQTVSGSSYSSTSGIIQYNGELFYVPATSFTFSNIPVLCFNTQYNNIAANADPVLFTDSISRNVLQTRTMQIVDGTSGTAGYISPIASVYIVNENNTNFDYSYTSTPYTTSTVFSTLTMNTCNSLTHIFVTAVFNSTDTTHVHSLQILKNGTVITTGVGTAYVTCSANGTTNINAQVITQINRGDIITCKINPHSGSTVNIDSYAVSVIQIG